MKKTFTFLFALLAAYTSQSQTCTGSQVVIVASKDTSNGTDIVHTKLLYDINGNPVQRNNYVPANPSFQTLKFIEVYYYNGTKLDSIIGFTDESKTTKNDVYKRFTYDVNGNLIKVVNKPEGTTEEVSTFTYASNKLSSITSSSFTVSGITFNGSNNLSTAKVVISGFTVTGNFASDTKINPFSGKLGLNDDVLSYFNTNNVLTFGATGVDAVTIVYSYDGNNRPIHSKRSEKVIGTNTLGSEITYGCLSDALLTSTRDEKISITSNISPNPSTDGIFNIAENIESVTVRNLTGSVVLQSTANKIDLSAQKSGIYILEIKTKDGLKMAKVVKE